MGALVRVALLLCSIAAAAAGTNNYAFCATSAGTNTESNAREPRRLVDDQGGGRVGASHVGCQPEREFHCRLENRCIPLEMRCDFQEQCLDGQDELGCPPESCTFSHNRCSWLNELTWGHAGGASGRNETTGSHSEGAPQDTEHERDVLWRRYVPTLDSPTTVRLSSGRILERPQRAAKGTPSTGLPSLMERLSGLLGAGEKFMFASMPSLPWPAARRRRREDKSASAAIKADGQNHDERPRQLRQRARMQTPEIGRTSAMCQLRFEYALWPAEFGQRRRRDAAGGPAFAMMDGAGGHSRAHIGGIETTLRLVARARRPTPESSGQDATPRTLWSRTVDWTGQTEEARTSETDRPEPASALDWTVGVAELGHLELSALSFEVESLTRALVVPANVEASEGRAGKVDRLLAGNASAPATTGSNVGGGEQTKASAAFVGSLVALKWLKFHGCREWPRRADLGGAHSLGGFEEAEEEEEEELEGLGIEIGGENEQPELPACRPDEFACPSSGFCLAQERLCNFVDECLGDAETTARNNGLLGVSTASSANQQMAAGSGGEDETLDLCGSILGRESFEAAQPDDKQAQLFLTSRPGGGFWHLSGNWTISRVALRHNRQRALHLPQVDHTWGTTRGERGSYLSLEVPDSAGLHWAAIKSQWMEKLNEREFGECRLKLFYNLVSSSQLRAEVGNLFASAGRDDSIRVSLAVEHYTLPRHLLTELERAKRDDGHLLLDRKLDALIQTGAMDRWPLDHASPLEYPGVDFWRELNLKLEGLEEGDLFLVRLVMYVELGAGAASRLRRTGERVSINLDDLGTHFGCGPVETEATRARLNQLSERHWLARGAAFLAQDYAPAAPPPQTTRRPSKEREAFLPRLKHKWDHFWPRRPARWWPATITGDDEQSTVAPSVAGGPAAAARVANEEEEEDEERQWRRPLQQIEPQKLIACVLGAFCLIIGLIALIVFVLVPHVERAMMNYQDQIQLSLSGEYSDLPVAHSSSSGASGSGSATTNFNSSPALGSPSLSARASRRSQIFDTFDWDAPANSRSLDMRARDSGEHSSSSSSSFSELSSGDTDERAPPRDGGASGRSASAGPSDGHEFAWAPPGPPSSEEDFHDASDK